MFGRNVESITALILLAVTATAGAVLVNRVVGRLFAAILAALSSLH